MELEADMDCIDVAEGRSRGEPLTAALQAHVSNCAVCSMQVPSSSAAGAALSPALTGVQEHVLANVKAEAWLSGRLAGLPTGVRVLLALAAAASLLGILLVAHPVTQPALSSTRGLLVVTSLAVGLVVVLRLGLRPLQEASPSPRLVRGMLGAGLALPVALALLPAGGSEVVPPLSAAGACLGIGALLGLPLVLAMRALDRGGHLSRGRALSAAVAGGLAGNLALELHCASHAPVHLLAGHATLGLLLGVLYGAFARLGEPQLR